MTELPFPKYSPENDLKVLELWKSAKLLDKINKRNENGKKFYFLQGPPYTSGKIHCGHAWNHALKDSILRYKRMNGYDVLARAGYDMHGLPTAHKVQKKLDLKGKEDIEKFGLANFAQECLDWSEVNSAAMSEDLKRFGITLDFSDPYKPITQNYIDSVWFLMKKAFEKDRLYLGEKTMSWCADCGTALAKHEQEYKEVRDNSIFLKFQKAGKENEYFVIWTTTPWTIPFNLAIMVNPNMEYVDCKVKTTEGNNEVWTVCKDLAGVFLGNVDDIEYEIGEPYMGSELEGQKYVHPWAASNPDVAEFSDAPKLFSVLLSAEYVDSSAGTGLVHCAPGCGPEDYNVGVANGLPPYNAISENGVFPERLEKFAGLRAKIDDVEFIKLMKAEGFLIKKSPIEHDYAHCERCHSPVVFRTTKQWFFKVEDLKEKMLQFNTDTYWHPQTAKNAFTSWLDNLRDNSITKQRFWGTPAPIWVHKNEDGEIDEHYVVGSREELEQLAVGELPKDLHKPWIDEVKIKSPKTGNELERIPDVLDVWIDAGCASWASLYYPARTDLFEKYFPADFIVEGKDQIRGWFNLLMVAGIIAFDKPVFDNVSMHGFISDVDGVKMSKSLGNIISPDEVVAKSSVDNFRYYFGQVKAGEDIAFSWDQLALHQRHITILWNTCKYLIDVVRNSGKDYNELLELGRANLGEAEKYILSKTNSVLAEVTKAYEAYKLDEVPSLIGELFLGISRDYIQAVRDKVNGSVEEQASVAYALNESLMTVLKMFSTVCPFVTESIYQNFKSEFDLDEESVHELMWPSVKNELVDSELESQFEIALNLISGVLAAREKAALNVRQPLAKSIIVSNKSDVIKAGEAFNEMICGQTNIKVLDMVEEFDKLEYAVKANFRNLGGDFGQQTATVGTAINALGKTDALHMHELFAEGKVFELKLPDDLVVEVKPNHVNFEISVADPYAFAEISQGIVALDTELSDELVNEGLSRELTRRIQNERKNLGLVKSDRIEIIMDNKDLYDKVCDYIDPICCTCGIVGFEVCEDKLGDDSVCVKLKGYEFGLLIKKL